jgi:hypothetical protein
MNAINYAFPVELQPIRIPNGVLVPKTKAVVRTDTNEPLCTVSDKYQLYKHAEVMDAVTPFIKKMGKTEVSYSLEKNGALLIATHTFPEYSFKVARAHKIEGDTSDRSVGDIISLQLHVINSYNKATSVLFKLGTKVLRCLNGATLLKGLFELRYTHMKNGWDRTLPNPDKMVTALNDMGRIYNRWSETEVTKQQIKAFTEAAILRGVFPLTIYTANEERFRKSETVWDLYNASTYLSTHGSSRIQQSGKIRRFDGINRIFMEEFEGAPRREVPAAAH